MIKKFKRIGAMVLGFFITLATKVLGYGVGIASEYGIEPPSIPAYGVESPTPNVEIPSIVEKFLPLLKILSIFIIPVILIIGLFVYTKRNKNNTNKSEKVKMAQNAYRALLVLCVLAIIIIIILYALEIIKI